MNDDGYIVLRKYIGTNDIESGRSCFKDGKMDYELMNRYVDNCLSKINPGLTCMKFRGSNNTNRTDASHFHRDTINFSKSEHEIYTILVYLDTAVMDLIPGSHKRGCNNIMEVAKSFFSSKTLTMNPGDILIMNANILHRGNFSRDMQNNRRLLQMFDCMTDESYKDYILHIPCLSQCKEKSLSFIKKINPNITFLNAASGYGNPFINSEYKYTSSEAGATRFDINGPNIQDDNRYYIRDNVINDVKTEQWYDIYHTIFIRPLIIYIALTLIVLLTIYLIKKKFIK